MKFSTTIPTLLATIATTSVNAFTPNSIGNIVNTPVANNVPSVAVADGKRSLMPLNMVASQEVEVNKRKKTKEVRCYFCLCQYFNSCIWIHSVHCSLFSIAHAKNTTSKCYNSIFFIFFE